MSTRSTLRARPEPGPTRVPAVLDFGPMGMRDAGFLGRGAKGQTTMLAPDRKRLLTAEEESLGELDRSGPASPAASRTRTPGSARRRRHPRRP
jgi:hypothetical protein